MLAGTVDFARASNESNPIDFSIDLASSSEGPTAKDHDYKNWLDTIPRAKFSLQQQRNNSTPKPRVQMKFWKNRITLRDIHGTSSTWKDISPAIEPAKP
jgi:hypothetical protein